MTFWPLTNSDYPTNQTFHQFHDLDTDFDLHRFTSGFHGAFATGVACQQRTLTLPDTWFRPHFWDWCIHLSTSLFLYCWCYNCWDRIPRTCHVFTRLSTSNTPWYFLYFAIENSVTMPACALRLVSIVTDVENNDIWIDNNDISGHNSPRIILHSPHPHFTLFWILLPSLGRTRMF